MTASVGNLKRLSSNAVRFGTTANENEDESDVMRGSKARSQLRDRALSVSNKSLRVRLSDDSQRCILPFRPHGSLRMKEIHELGAIGTLIGSATMTNPLATAIAEEIESTMISEFFKHNFSKQEVRVVVLGAPGVGKTSIVQQFVANQFPAVHLSTATRCVYHPVVITPKHLLELKLCDAPPVDTLSVPTASRRDVWHRYAGLGLRGASVFVLVYDVTSDDSFQFIARLHDELVARFDATQTQPATAPDATPSSVHRRVPVVVVGNKVDLLASRCDAPPTPRTARHKPSVCPFVELETAWNPLELMLDDGDAARARASRARVHRKSATNRSVSSIRLQPQDEQKRLRSRLLKKLSSVNSSSSCGDGYGAVVTRNWKALHVECSAKCNWNVCRVFEEILKLVTDEKCEMSRKNSRKNALSHQRHTKCTVS